MPEEKKKAGKAASASQAEELRRQAKTLLEKAKRIEEEAHAKLLASLGNWILQHQETILASLPENLSGQLQQILQGGDGRAAVVPQKKRKDGAQKEKP